MYRPTHDSGTDVARSIRSDLPVLESTLTPGGEASPPPTCAALHLFLHAAFAAREPALLGEDKRETAALFGIGAISQAAALARLPDRESRSLRRALLRWTFGLGHLRAWQWERGLRRQALTRRGRLACHEGGSSLLGWLRGEDPAKRLSRLLDAAPVSGARRAPHARPAPVRPLTARPH